MANWLEFWHFTSADWAGLTFAVVLGAAVLALIEARTAIRLREDQVRPYVTIDLHADKSQLFFLTVTNLGRSMATDVRFTIEPPLESAALPKIPKIQMLDPNGGIPSLPPGKRIPTAFDYWHDRVKRPDLPVVYRVTAEYSAEPRRVLFWTRPRNYRDPPIVLDFGVYRDSIPDNRKDIHDVATELKLIRNLLMKSHGA